MPDILGWVIFRGSKHTNLLPLDLPSLTVRGLAPKFSKRTILTGLVLFPYRVFSHVLNGYIIRQQQGQGGFTKDGFWDNHKRADAQGKKRVKRDPKETVKGRRRVKPMPSGGTLLEPKRIQSFFQVPLVHRKGETGYEGSACS